MGDVQLNAFLCAQQWQWPPNSLIHQLWRNPDSRYTCIGEIRMHLNIVLNNH